MKHHQTRRRSRNLKKRTSRRRSRLQSGGAIQSIGEWFRAVKEFETAKGLGENYTINILQDDSLKLPSYDTFKEDFNINDGNYIDFDIRQVPELLKVLYPILEKTPTPDNFKAYVSPYKTVAEDDQTEVGNTANAIRTFEELEAKLTDKAKSLGLDNDRTFTSIYDIPKRPLYIWYLTLNPNAINENDVVPMLTKLPRDIPLPS